MKPHTQALSGIIGPFFFLSITVKCFRVCARTQIVSVKYANMEIKASPQGETAAWFNMVDQARRSHMVGCEAGYCDH